MKLKRNTKSVYVILNKDNGRVKIGVSDNPEERIQSLMHQGGCMMSIMYKSHQISNANEVERNLHAMFVDKRFVGEWFNITPTEAIKMVRKLVKNRHDCKIVRDFESGMYVSEIARRNDVSRTAIVNYLHKKGYHPKDRSGVITKKNKYVAAKPHQETSSIESSSLEKMVEINNAKMNERRKKNSR